MKIELHVFTNCTEHISIHQPIFETVASFRETFGEIKTNIWLDRSPNHKDSRTYLKSVVKEFSNVKISQSLSDGYIRAVKDSDSDFLFMLEHDWTFNKHLIRHTLDDICKVMTDDGIHHFKFSMVDNSVVKSESNHWQYPIQYVNGSVPYHTVRSASNNPHIINRSLYLRDLMSRVRVGPGSFGIEDYLNRVDSAKFAVYGGPDLAATINHTDGRLARGHNPAVEKLIDTNRH